MNTCFGCGSKLTDEEHAKMLKNATLLTGFNFILNKIITGKFFSSHQYHYKAKRFEKCFYCGKYNYK